MKLLKRQQAAGLGFQDKGSFKSVFEVQHIFGGLACIGCDESLVLAAVVLLELRCAVH